MTISFGSIMHMRIGYINLITNFSGQAMKTKLFSLCGIAITMMLFCFSALAVPKYTDKETALKLAKTLDKGAFGRYTISSAYVQNDNVSQYYISVILSDGSAHKWYISQIYKWSREDKLLLENNRTLLFLDPRDTVFVVLDKNRFHRMALKSNIYIKSFAAGDPLHGKQFRFFVKTFSLISPTETAFGRDNSGSKYRYIIDLYNGMRELLTYEDAFGIMTNSLLIAEKKPIAPTFKHAYAVTKVVAHPKKPAQNGVSQFGVEIQFDRPIMLEGEDFPYQMYERKRYDRRKKKSKKEFILDITIPNSEKKFEIQGIDHLEYLQNIMIVKDPKHSKRLMLRAAFNPTVMDIPPTIYKNSDNSVFVNFFNFIDQTILSRGMLLEAQKRRDEEQKSIRKIKVTKAIKRDSDYGRAFIAGTESHKDAQTIRAPLERINKLLTGIKQFEEAALYAEKDAQLYNALKKRNQLRETIIVLSLDYIKDKLAKETVEVEDSQKMVSMLDQAESFTSRQQVLRDIGMLREKVMATQR